MRVAVRCRLSEQSLAPNAPVKAAHPGITMTTATTPQTPKPVAAQYFPIDSVMCLVRHYAKDRARREPAADTRQTDPAP